MIIIAESDSFDKLKVIIGGGDDYAIIRFALRAFVDTKIKDMNPEDKLLDAIFSGSKLRKAAKKILGQLREQEKLLPLFIEANKVAEKELDKEEKELIQDCRRRKSAKKTV